MLFTLPRIFFLFVFPNFRAIFPSLRQYPNCNMPTTNRVNEYIAFTGYNQNATETTTLVCLQEKYTLSTDVTLENTKKRPS